MNIDAMRLSRRPLTAFEESHKRLVRGYKYKYLVITEERGCRTKKLKGYNYTAYSKWLAMNFVVNFFGSRALVLSRPTTSPL